MPSVRSSPLRLIAPWLMGLALLARLIVPAGFMPGLGSHGAPALVICSGQGPMGMPGMAAMPMAHHGKPDAPKHDGQGGDHGCPFGAFAAAADRTDQPALSILSAAPAAALLTFRLAARPGLGLAAPPPPKTGPPVTL